MLVWLKKRREDLMLTQDNIAQEIGVSRCHYTNIENGSRKPSIALAKKIATILQFEWTDFYK